MYTNYTNTVRIACVFIAHQLVFVPMTAIISVLYTQSSGSLELGASFVVELLKLDENLLAKTLVKVGRHIKLRQLNAE